MSSGANLPPQFRGDVASWAKALTDWLSPVTAAQRPVQPQAVQLAHYIASGAYSNPRPGAGGLLIYDPSTEEVWHADANDAFVALINAKVIVRGSGSPEGSVTASPGTLYLNSAGGAGTTLYVKETGTGNTGWVGK